MATIFILLFLACIVCLILGIIKPTLVIKWGDLEKRNRKSVLKYYGIGLIFTFILIAVFSPKTTNTVDKSTTAKVENTVKEEPKEKTEEEKAAEVAKQKADEKAKADADAKIAAEKAAKDVPKEYQSALKKADLYANKMNLSKKSLYDQLTSDYGEKFPKEAAQYAVDNVKADWKKNALAKAKSYQDKMNMSKKAIHDQLVSEAGEKFTEEEAQYAINNLEK
jgi:type IV secretory pathway VirB10-like protein